MATQDASKGPCSAFWDSMVHTYSIGKVNRQMEFSQSKFKLFSLSSIISDDYLFSVHVLWVYLDINKAEWGTSYKN